MASRVTKEAVAKAVALLSREFGFQLAATERGDGLLLDHNATYGGYVIVADGGSSMPFGNQRRSGLELIEAIHFAVRVKQYRDGLN